MRLLILLPFLAGCAAAIQVGPAGPDPTPTIVGEGVDPGATIIVYRRSEAGFVGNIAATPAITYDGRSVGTCRFDRPLVLRVPAGTHQVAVLTENGQVNQQVVVRDGETGYLRCGTAASPAFSPKPALQAVDRATAERELNL